MTSRSFVLALSFVSLAACDTDPGAPVPVFRTLDLELVSPSFAYGEGASVALVASVVDSRGGLRPEAAVTFTPDPADRAQDLGGSTVQDIAYSLTGSGPITFTACITAAPTICDQVTIVVDDGKPVLAVDSPTPGEQIDDPDGVRVHGTALDSSPTLEVFVNGERVTIAADHTFELVIPPRFGVRHVDVVATDALTETARYEMDVMYAAAFTPATDDMGAPSFSLDDSVGIWLGQDFFDDGEALDETAMPLVTRDVADIVQLLVENAALGTLIPNPISNTPTLALSIPTATLGEPHVELSVQDDGIDLFVRANALTLTTTGSFNFGGEMFDLAGTITGSAVVYARLTITKATPTSDVQVSLSDLQIAIESVNGDFVDPDVDALFTVASSLLRGTIEGFVHDALEGVLASSVPDVLESVLSGIDHAIEGVSIDLNQPPLPAVSLQIDGRMSRVESVYRQHVLAPLTIGIASTSTNVHPGSRGVGRMTASSDLPGFFDAGSVQVGVQLGFLNGVLHVLYSAGLLDLDVKPLIPPQAAALVSAGSLSPQLPPVLRPPRENETTDLVLSIGQLDLNLTSQGRMRHFGVTIEAGVDITVVDNVVRLAVSETPTIYVWENEKPDSVTVVSADLVRNLLQMVWPTLRDALVSSLAIELPIPALPLGGIAPSLDGFTLTLSETATRLYPRGELLLLDAAFTGRVPGP